MADITERYLQYQVENMQIKEDEKEVYRYGYTLLKLQCMNLLIAILIGAAFQCISFLALFLTAFIPLRTYSGGYHAETAIRCTLLSAGMELVVAAVYRYGLLRQMGDILYLLVSACMVIIWRLAPLAATNKPLNANETAVYRRIARNILLIHLAVMIVCRIAGFERCGAAVAMAQILEAVLLLAWKYRYKIRVKTEMQ